MVWMKFGKRDVRSVAEQRALPLALAAAGASSFSPNRSGGGAGGGKREWKSPLLGD